MGFFLIYLGMIAISFFSKGRSVSEQQAPGPELEFLELRLLELPLGERILGRLTSGDLRLCGTGKSPSN